jgi:hypothetical protein
MTIALSFFHGIATSWASMYRNLKQMLAVLAYVLALAYTWYCTTVGIALSYVYVNDFVVAVWVVVMVTCILVWFAAIWAILLLTLEKKRRDAHLVLLPLSLYATIVVMVMAAFSAFAARNTDSGLDAFGFTIMFAIIAVAVLHACIRHALMVWQGKGIYAHRSI